MIAFVGSRSTNVLVVSVEALIGSLNEAVTTVARLTPVAPLAGVTLVMVGGVVSGTAVVNDQTKLLARALPAVSFTPELPPVIVAGYEIGRASCRERVEISGVAVSLKKKK